MKRGIILSLILFVFGLIIGSFLNVVIYRLPRGESIVLPPSHCTNCQHRLKPWDLIPVLSYLGLRGKCRYCQTKINLRYPLVELLTAFLTVLWWYRVGQFEPNINGIATLVLTYAMVVVSLIDLDLQIIPNKITLPLVVAGLTLQGLQGELTFAALGLLAGGGPFALIAFFYGKGMGWGDVKLLAMLGIFLGWHKIIICMFLGSLLGVLWMAPLMLLKKIDRKTPFAFGPFLATAALLIMYFGEELLTGVNFLIFR
jgi:leader peptidase (prepilin peptidase)/N-methyltransferase